MKKRIISLVLTICLVLSVCLTALGAMSLSNFDSIRTYSGEFSDIPRSAWYFPGVSSVYERGLMEGKGAGLFDPSGNLTIAETIKIAAMLHKGYHTGSMDFEPGTPWYAPYLEYALSNGIPVGAYRNFNAAATRSDFALIIAGALPDEALTPMNRVVNGGIPDVFEIFSYGQAVYKLYRAGILTGSDSEGTFFPGRTLTRAEAAAIIMRVVDANTRVPMSLAAPLTGEQIYIQASPAVFFVEVLDKHGDVEKTGSGFFISSSGLAVTNYHVVVGASSMRITTDIGEVYEVAGIYDYDRINDGALIQIDGKGFPYLEMADSSKLLTGATVYALGSPLRLQASFSKGIVSQALREVDGMSFIQLDAAISTGSSGGALLDTTGRVVGVTTATMIGSQNINLAVPISLFEGMNHERYVPISSILMTTSFYADYYPTPDFGAQFDVRPFRTEPQRGGTSFSYRLRDLHGDVDDIINEYMHLLDQNFFEHVGFLTSGPNTFLRYYNTRYDIMLTLGKEVIRDNECFTVNARASNVETDFESGW